MAIQAQVPGGAYVNETTARQSQIPGFQYYNDTTAGGGGGTFKAFWAVQNNSVVGVGVH